MNTALTLASGGLYMPWVRVRTRRSFLGNIRLQESGLDYQANPRAMFFGWVVSGLGFTLLSSCGDLLTMGLTSAVQLLVKGSWIVPLLSAGVSAAIPAAVERQLGEAVLASLDKQPFAPSRLPGAKQQQVRNLVQRIEATAPADRRLRLELRDSQAIGANAFCLPGGILVVTDALVRLASEEELLAVLAHEAGHDRHRHPLQRMVRGHALTLATGLIGGHDNPIQGITEGLVGNAYSRAFEHQADREALAVLRRFNLTPAPFFSILDKLERQQGKTEVPSFLLTHPSNPERQARAAGS